MRKLLVFLLLQAFAAATTFTSTTSGNLSSGSTWVGGSAPNCAGGDIIVVATGHAVTVDTNCTLGSKASNVGDAFTVQATNSTTFGELIVPNGVTLTLRGTDLTANRIGKINQHGKFTVQSGATVVVDLASDYASIIRNDGHFSSNGATWDIPSGNINWNNASGTRTLSAVSHQRWYSGNNIFILKLDTSSKADPGPISNAAGSALGSSGDTSFAITSGGFQGTTSTAKNCGASIATIADNLTDNGDYCIDYQLAILWYRSTNGNLTVTYNFKYATWFGYGVLASANTTGSSMLVDNSTFNYCGWHSGSATETSGGGLHADNKFAPTLDASRAVRFVGNTFNNCARPIDLKCTSTATTSSDPDDRIYITGNTFNYSRFNNTNFLQGNINLGYCRYVTIATNTYKSFAHFFGNPGRGTSIGLLVQSNTGAVNIHRILTSTSVGSTVELNDLTGWSGTADVANIEFGGDATNGNNVYQDNIFGYANRSVRLTNRMDVRRNVWYRTYHHGAVHQSATAYINLYTFEYNVIRDSCLAAGGDLGGGWTLGYNQTQWIDNVTVRNNTFDCSLRTINFNDAETTVALGTRLKILNNIGSNSVQGIYQPANTSSNVSAIALTRLDYNDDYNNTTTPTNVKQATFIRNSAEYNEGTRNIAGIYIFNPSYSLPEATQRTLELVVSGTSGTNKAMNLTWGGGTAVNLVEAQGTATAGTATTLTNSGASFTTSGSGLKTFQVCITGGTGSGQCAMISANTATQLTIVSNTSNAQWAVTPDNTSVYVVLKSQVSLAHSGGGQTISAGVYSPGVTFTNGTYTDSGITIETHAFNADPQYVSTATGDMRPQNATLDGAGHDGTDIGALSVLLSTGNAAPRRSHRAR